MYFDIGVLKEVPCQLVFRNPFMAPFTIATLSLAVLAIYLGHIR
jgi:hypothetical protein